MRFSLRLLEFAAFLATLAPSIIKRIREAFDEVKAAAPVTDTNSFRLSALETAHPCPETSALVQAAADELRGRQSSGWNPSHVVQAVETFVPQLASAAPPPPDEVTDAPPAAAPKAKKARPKRKAANA